MKNCFLLISSMVLSAALTAGCVTSSPTTAPRLPVVQMAAGADMQLDGRDAMAVTVLDFARSGSTPEADIVRLKPEAKVLLAAQEPGFIQTAATVTNARDLPDGSTLVEVLRRFEDTAGRTQMILDMAAYTIRELTKEEAKANAASLIADYKAVMRTGTPEAKQEAGNAVNAFQRQNGLTSDGVLGPKTAQAMVAALGVQEFSLLASSPVYPDGPRFALYFMDEVVAQNAPETYLKGFDSIDAVAAQAIPVDTFPSRSASGGSYLAMLYFFDQLPKGAAVQVGFSESSNRKDSDYRGTMPPVYSSGEGWVAVPVPFRLERHVPSTIPKKLYALVLVNGEIVRATQLR